MTTAVLLDIFLMVGFAILFVLGVVGNLLVLHVFKRRWKRLSGMETLICYLATFDLLASITQPLLYIYWQHTKYKQWHFGRWACKVFPVLSALLLTMSFLLISFITLDRCRAICRPFTPRLKSYHIRIGVFVCLLTAILYELPYLLDTDLMSYVKITVTCQQFFKDPSTFHQLYLNTNQSYFIGYMPCAEVLDLNYSVNALKNDKRFQYLRDEHLISTPTHALQQTATRCLTQCEFMSQACNPKLTDAYTYPRIVLLLLRNSVFVFLFVLSNYFIYQELYDKERKVILTNVFSISAKKVFNILITMAAVFIVLVFPKDIFFAVYTISWLNPPGLSYVDFSRDLNSFLTLLQVSNSVCNVFIYARLHSRFSKEMHKFRRSIFSSLDSFRRYSFRRNSFLKDSTQLQKVHKDEKITKEMILSLRETIL